MSFPPPLHFFPSVFILIPAGRRKQTPCFKLQSIAILEPKLVWLVWQGNLYFPSEITCVPCTRSEISVPTLSEWNSKLRRQLHYDLEHLLRHKPPFYFICSRKISHRYSFWAYKYPLPQLYLRILCAGIKASLGHWGSLLGSLGPN